MGLLLALVCVAAPVGAQALDWNEIAREHVVRVVTVDADGDLRVTKVWIVAHGGAGWLRTSNSRWLANLRRDANLVLRAGGRELELRAEEVSDPALRESVDAAMRAKYGWADRLLGPFRWRAVQVLRLGPRAP